LFGNLAFTLLMLLNAERDLTLPLLQLARFLVVFVLRNAPAAAEIIVASEPKPGQCIGLQGKLLYCLNGPGRAAPAQKPQIL
jgi:hypothetical protein